MNQWSVPLMCAVAVLMSACGGARRLPLNMNEGPKPKQAGVLAACEAFPASPEIAHIECIGGIVLSAVNLELPQTEAGLRAGVAEQTDAWRDGAITCVGMQRCTRSSQASSDHSERAMAVATPHSGSGVFVAVCSAPPGLFAQCPALVDAIQGRGLSQIASATLHPATVDFAGRALRLHSSCHRKGVQHLKCLEAGQMDWQTPASLIAAKAVLKRRRAETLRGANAAGGQLSKRTFPCQLDGVTTSCVRTVNNLLPAPWRWFDDRPLIVLSAAAEVRGRPVLAVCSFWRWQAPRDGIAALCAEVFSLAKATPADPSLSGAEHPDSRP